MNAVIRIGSRSSEVQRVQELLNKRLEPCPVLRLDGIFGKMTESAVRHYQISVGLPVDGIVGDATWSALIKGLSSKEVGGHPPAGTFFNAPWMEIARREIGQKEIVGRRDNPRILEYHASTTLGASDDETPWCSSFVNWCLKAVGIKGTNSAAAGSWVHWGVTSGPTPGAITIICCTNTADRSFSTSGAHVGFLLNESSSCYELLGGNQRNMVKASRYPKSSWKLLGRRWPTREGIA